jgi:hypothetical protein
MRGLLAACSRFVIPNAVRATGIGDTVAKDSGLKDRLLICLLSRCAAMRSIDATNRLFDDSLAPRIRNLVNGVDQFEP